MCSSEEIFCFEALPFVDELHEVAQIVLYQMITNHLNFENCMQWVPKMLTKEYKTNRVHYAWEIFDHYVLYGKLYGKLYGNKFFYSK